MPSSNYCLPNVWGPGQLLAFSGIDGELDWARQLVLHTDEQPGAFIIRLPAEVSLSFENLPTAQFELIVGDAIEVKTDEGNFRCAFVDGSTLAGEMPGTARLLAAGQPVGAAPTVLAEANGVAVHGIAQGSRWAISTNGIDAATAALKHDIAALVKQRSAFVRELAVPEQLEAWQQQLLRKAASVIKVNTMPAVGLIRRPWTTPDRWPHRYMWLWDSAFQAVGLSYLMPDMAKQTLLAILDHVQDDGFLPHRVRPDGEPTKITQPPILAWAVRHLAETTQDRDFAAACVDPLGRYLDWDRANRDVKGNGLLQWAIEGDPLCRSGESGLDNSPRFDRACELDAVDFTCFMAGDLGHLAALHEMLNQPEPAARRRAQSEEVAAAVNQHLWDEEAGLYVDRDLEGQFTHIHAVSGFLPLFAGITSEARANRLGDHLNNPATFGTAFPLPSVAVNHGVFTKDMWRGPTWVNMNWLITLGFQNAGLIDAAQHLRRRTLEEIGRWYQQHGAVYEYYDSLGVTAPRDLDRKQRLSSGQGMAPISDYHWTASATVALLLEPTLESSTQATTQSASA